MTKQPKLTRWFSRRVKPIRVGVYETKVLPQLDSTPDFQYWDGRVWGCVSADPEQAYARKRLEGYFQNVPWRGLAVKP
jgi:hypothetical protein